MFMESAVRRKQTDKQPCFWQEKAEEVHARSWAKFAPKWGFFWVSIAFDTGMNWFAPISWIHFCSVRELSARIILKRQKPDAHALPSLGEANDRVTPPFDHSTAQCPNNCQISEGPKVKSQKVPTPQKIYFTLNCFRVVPK